MPSGWKLPAERPGRPPDAELSALRAKTDALIARSSGLQQARPDIPRRKRTIANIECHEVGRPDADGTVLYLHGGGFRLGDPAMWVTYAAGLAEDAGVRLILPKYRLAPEHPFPAALRDVADVYAALVVELGSRPLLVMGESAGASLTASLTTAAIMNDYARLPDGLIMISASTDLSRKSGTYQTKAGVDTVHSRASAERSRDLYLQGYSYDDPLVSPIKADLSKFPPMQVFCGGHEVLIGDSTSFVEKAARSDCTVEAHFLSNMEHGWSFVSPDLPESRATARHVVRFIRQTVDAATARAA
jgi:acetyl esterase/lipase